MFEKASRLKLRFATAMGNLTTEDLWDVPLIKATSLQQTSLDSIAQGLSREVKNSAEEESFVVKKSKTDSVLELKFEIVKHVIEVKLEELEAADKAAVNKARKQQIMEIISGKEDDHLKGKSLASLRKMLDDI